MRIEYAIPVRHVERLADGSLLAVGIESTFAVNALPTRIVTPLVVCFACAPNEAGVDFPFALRIYGPDLELAGEPFDQEFHVDLGPDLPDGWEPRCVMDLTAQFDATMSGTYTIELSWGDSSPVSVNYTVRDPT